MKALALCHNVSPVREEGEGRPLPPGEEEEEEEESEEEVLFQQEESSHGVQGISYQASSPDEVSSPAQSGSYTCSVQLVFHLRNFHVKSFKI